MNVTWAAAAATKQTEIAAHLSGQVRHDVIVESALCQHVYYVPSSETKYSQSKMKDVIP